MHEQLIQQIRQIPPNLHPVISEVLEAFIAKAKIQQPVVTHEVNPRLNMFGCMRGKFNMSDDFNEPLEDFSEYM